MIVQTADTLGGAPRVDGTRMPVEMVLHLLSSGETPEEIEKNYPITAADISACLAFAAKLVAAAKIPS